MLVLLCAIMLMAMVDWHYEREADFRCICSTITARRQIAAVRRAPLAFTCALSEAGKVDGRLLATSP
jgi:hypothetical protein